MRDSPHLGKEGELSAGLTTASGLSTPGPTSRERQEPIRVRAARQKGEREAKREKR